MAFLIALTATIAVGVAQESGEALEERVQETRLVEEHTEQGEQVLPWAIALTVAGAAVAGAELLRRRYPHLAAARVTAVLVVTVTGVGATWTIIEVGHSGATARWGGRAPTAGD